MGKPELMEEVRICSYPMPGYGLLPSSIEQVEKAAPDLIVCQGTSTDCGPFYLGEGKSFLDASNVKADLRTILDLALRLRIPFIFSLGGAGGDVHLEEALGIVGSLAHEEGWRFSTAVISGELDKEWLRDRIGSGAKSHKLAPLERLPDEIPIGEVDRSTRIVAQMGPEPIMKALDLVESSDVNGIIVGRSLDTGLLAAPLLKRKFSKPNCWHFGLVLHDGGQATEPTGHDGTLGVATNDYFTISPLSPFRRCTPTSVASMSFYERADITREYYPGGYLDLSKAKFEQVDLRTVKVSGSEWFEMPYTIKVEGAAPIGYRTISIAGLRDPILISHIQEMIVGVKKYVAEHIGTAGYRVHIRTYGRNGVLEGVEPTPDDDVHELGIVIDIVAQDQTLANRVCSLARSSLLHIGFQGRKSTAGNLAFPYSPHDVPVGRVYEFNIWHAVELENPLEPFPIKVREFA